VTGLIDQPRNARSRRTARELLTAARTLIEEGGFAAMTMAAVAERAGVTRRAVYLHFATRAQLLAALFRHVNEEAGLAESVARVWAAPDAVAALDEWAAHTARFAPRILPVARAVERVDRDDPDAALHREQAARGRRASCRRLMRALADEGRLKPGWTVASATDMMLALSSLDVVETLLVERRWSRQRFTAHYSMLLRDTFVGAGPS